MQRGLKSLLYSSRRAAPLDDAQIYDIYRAAMANNALEGITGLLVHDGDFFVQLLEGGDEAVDAMMVKLYADPRHCDITVAEERPIESRNFGGWSMKLIKVDHAPFFAVEDLGAEIGAHVDPEIRQLVLDTVAGLAGGD